MSRRRRLICGGKDPASGRTAVAGLFTIDCYAGSRGQPAMEHYNGAVNALTNCTEVDIRQGFGACRAIGFDTG